MKAHSLSSFLSPRSVAVVGVSANETKLGSVILKNILAGFTGQVYGVNPKLAGQRVQGVACWAELQDIGQPVDVAVVVVPAKYVLDIAHDAAKAKVENLIIITAGFGEVGNMTLQNDVLAVCQKANIRVLGPNCLGAILPHAGLNASFADGTPKAGGIAFVSQSGAFCTAALDYARGRNLGFSHFISLGNKSDINELDLLQAFNADENVTAVAFYLESVTDGPAFLAAIRACSKPVIILEPGVSQAAQAASASHTGALAPSAEILKAAYRHAGAVQVWTMQELFMCLELITANAGKRAGKNVAIVTNAGGVGVLSSDLVEAAGLHLPPPSTGTLAALNEDLPATAGLGNPYDIIGDAPASRYKSALDALARDPHVDQVLVLLTPQATTEVDATARHIIDFHERSDKAIVAAFVGGPGVASGVHLLRENGVVCDRFPSVLLRSMGLLERALKGAAPPLEMPKVNTEITQIIAQEKAQNLTSLAAQSVSRIAELVGLPVPKSAAFTDHDAAFAFFQSIEKPAVLKISSPDALHKTELKGVLLNIITDQDFASGWYALQRSIQTAKLPNAMIQIQEQVPEGIELIIGFKRDKTFGNVMVFGTGGIYSEVWQDTSITLLPTRDFEETFLHTRVGKVLSGVRGQTPVNMADLIGTLMKLEALFLTQRELVAIDINPAIVANGRVHVVDIKLILRD